MFGRTERLFTRGQRALARRDFAAAETLLREALARDPGYAHVHLYLAHALAEQERLAEAERSLAVALEQAPTSFAFHLHRGIILLDAGDPARARDAVAAAARLAPDNRVVAGYAELIAWTQRGGPPTARLAQQAGDLPESFGARALQRLAETTLETRGAKAAVALLDPPLEPMGLPLTLWLGGLRHRDRLRYAERLLGSGRFDDAAYFITSQPALMADTRAPALLEQARRGALREVGGALAGCAPARRATLLLHRYEVENELGDHDAVLRTLTEWRDAYTAAGAPAGQRHLAAAVMRRMAAVEIERGRPAEALALCAASRVARAERETAGVEALARLALGQRRAARHAFEDFLQNALFPLDVRLREAAGSSAA
jgi:tetratricopeptide (TPR) repeat protein